MPTPTASTAPGATSARLFLALCPSAPVRAALAEHVAQWRWPRGASRYAPADWHVTLHFLGGVPRDRLDELRAQLAVPLAPFELRFGRPALWPHGLAVLLPREAPDALHQLQARLAQRLRAQALRVEERAYRPHLTLARHAAQAEPPAQAPDFSWAVEGYALMESTGDGALRYRVLQHYGSAPAV